MSGAFGMEQWRFIPGFKSYMVSNLGRVYSSLSDRCLTPQPSGSGHLRVALRKDGRTHLRLVHRLVLIAFVGPCPDGKEALHYDDDPMNNRIDNLRWGTRSENRRDAVRNSRLRGGTQKGHALTRDQAKRAKRWLAQGISKTRIAKALGVSRTTIAKIERGEIWADVI